MKIIKSKPKCVKCGDWRIFLHCIAVMVNGCDKHFCLLCWPDHAKEHDLEWDQMTQTEKDKLIKEYNG
jgi:hypothetical protein